MKHTLESLSRLIAPDLETGCWEWVGGRYRDGYGSAPRGAGTAVAHRLVYALTRGPIARGLTLDHLCRNRGCVNPDHLEPVTMGENTRRAPASISTINAAKTHCVNGHEFDDRNTYRPAGGNRRRCRACNRESAARYALRRMGGVS